MKAKHVTYLLFLIVFFANHSMARLKSGSEKSFERADCVYIGEFTRVEPLQVNGHDIRPVSISAATLKVKKIVKTDGSICSSRVGEVDVIFSNGRSNGVGFSDHCREPLADKKDYQVALRIEFDGTLVPAGCFDWFRQVK